ncbi:energy-coupling factor transporter transmembrane component T family protein [Desulfovibrio cuneatus]|uniref:energy-coupling factor transporter transmembrane component T family protein n=1 Tax=Desulfovibrio cuneatus TaxID=159728 RepID=UPI00041A1368|nr:energy-coupling factor transporter transmembrane component T [Desulfovibrio cuneatus]
MSVNPTTAPLKPTATVAGSPARIHPAVHVAGLFVCSLALSFTHTLWAAAYALAVSLPLPFLKGLPWRTVLGRMALGNLFVLFIWLTMPFTLGQHPVATLPFGLAVYAEGLTKSLLLTLKINCLLALGLAFLHTASVHETAKALATLGVPHKLTLLLLLTARHMHSLWASYRTVCNAAALRGFTPCLRLRKLPKFAALVTFVLLKSLERADNVDAAMRLRGFTGAFPAPLFAPAKQHVVRGVVAYGLALVGLLVIEHLAP